MFLTLQNTEAPSNDPESASAAGICDNDASFMSYEDTDTSFVSEVSSLYLPTPEKRAKQSLTAVSVPKKLCFVDITSLQSFINQINEIRRCTTPGCGGKIVPTEVKSIGLGGAISVFYACNGCVTKFAEFESSPKFSGIGRMTEISMSVQVAFIVAGCTHATYYKVLKNYDAVLFAYTIQLLHPVVSKMLEELCAEAKLEMRNMDQSQ